MVGANCDQILPINLSDECFTPHTISDLLIAVPHQLLGGAAECHHPFSCHLSLCIFFLWEEGVAGFSVPMEFSQTERTYLSSVKSTLECYEIRSLASCFTC